MVTRVLSPNDRYRETQGENRNGRFWAGSGHDAETWRPVNASAKWVVIRRKRVPVPQNWNVTSDPTLYSLPLFRPDGM